MEIKTFADLKFEPHALNQLGGDFEKSKIARLMFDNGYGVSVVKDCPCLTDCHKYELVLLKNGNLWCSSKVDSIYRADNKREASLYMLNVQNLPPCVDTRN